MSNPLEKPATRRTVLKAASGAVAAAAAPKFALGGVHVTGADEIRVALVGCGGRGSGAAVNAMATQNQGPIKLVAMADVFKDRLDSSFENVGKAIGAQMDVPADRRFVGFDAYKKAMDCLRPGDVVILTTPPAFRWPHFTYAIQKKLNVFMEKPVTVDGPTSRRMLELGKKADAAGLKVGVGLMSRHARPLQELKKRIDDGEIGEIVLMRGYRMHGPAGYFSSTPKPSDVSDLEHQIRRFHSFLWASGGCYNDFYIHIVDHLCWMKGMWPEKAQALGGRHFKTTDKGVHYVDQNLDTYSVEYTFKDGTKMLFDGRCVDGAWGQYSSYVHGTRGSAIASRANDCGGPSATFRDHTMAQESLVWQSSDRSNPYQNEWDALVDAIRNGKPYNEVERGVYGTLSSSLGRMAAHTGQEVTFDQMLNCDHEFAPNVDELDYNQPAPLQADSTGMYPIPMPGQKSAREF